MIKTDKNKITRSVSAFMQYQRKLGFGVYQPEIAEQTGITQSQLSNYENEKMIPSLPAIIALADMFDVSIDYLVGRCENSQAHKTSKTIKYLEE